jgi:hypothetical protein
MRNLLHRGLFESEPRAQRRGCRHDDAVTDTRKSGWNAPTRIIPRAAFRSIVLDEKQPVAGNAEGQADKKKQPAATYPAGRALGWRFLWHWFVHLDDANSFAGRLIRRADVGTG